VGGVGDDDEDEDDEEDVDDLGKNDDTEDLLLGLVLLFESPSNASLTARRLVLGADEK